MPRPRDTTLGDYSVRVSRLSVGGHRLAVLSFPAAAPTILPELTAAESEVAALALGGSSNEEIAHERASSSRTVANQVASVFRKLGVTSRAELAAAVWRRLSEPRAANDPATTLGPPHARTPHGRDRAGRKATSARGRKRG